MLSWYGERKVGEQKVGEQLNTKDRSRRQIDLEEIALDHPGLGRSVSQGSYHCAKIGWLLRLHKTAVQLLLLDVRGAWCLLSKIRSAGQDPSCGQS